MIWAFTFHYVAAGRDYAIREALGDPSYSVAEDGFGGVNVRVLSDRPHASLYKAAAIVGIGRSNVRSLDYPYLYYRSTICLVKGHRSV